MIFLFIVNISCRLLTQLVFYNARKAVCSHYKYNNITQKPYIKPHPKQKAFYNSSYIPNIRGSNLGSLWIKMVKRIGRSRRKTRGVSRKNIRRKGKIRLSRYFQKLKEGENVVLSMEPAVQKGLYFRRFHGKKGIVAGRKGRCYNILVMDGKKQKTLIVHPVHLKKI